MKRFTVLFFFLTLFGHLTAAAAIPAYAVDIPVHGEVTNVKKKKLPPATPEMVDEALGISAQCHGYKEVSDFYDCDCLGMKFLELRQQKGPVPSFVILEAEARKLCPNRVGVAGTYYQYCMEWAPNVIGSKADDLCTCYGRQYSKIYAKNPSSDQLVREAQMTNALGLCKFATLPESSNERAKWVQQLKDKGIYESLFPSSKNDPHRGGE